MPRVLELACAQMGIVLMILRRDTPKRLFVSASISAAVVYFADWWWGYATAAVLLLNEFMFYLVHRKSTDPRAEVGVQRTVAAIFFISVSMLPYTFPGIVLMSQPDQGAQILGLFWICAALVYILAIYSMTVILGWSTIVVHTIGLGIGIFALHPGPVTPMGSLDMAVLVFFTMLWMWNAYEFMNASANNRRAFGEARSQAEARLKKLNHLVNHDHLTGLMNRRAFYEALGDVLLTHQVGSHLAVVLIDLDGFKPINDTYGHAAGDFVLVTVAKRLTEIDAFRAPARLGGDEFVLLLPNLGPSHLPSLLGDMSEALAAPIFFEGTWLSVGASAGYAYARERSTVTQLLAEADMAMYDIKMQRKSSGPASPVARLGKYA
ncbi:MAG: diguanylate cyclase [Pseudomonadota bacterium]